MSKRPIAIHEVLLVSKPVAPPWNDSSKNLVRDLSCNLRRHRAVVMTPRSGKPVPLGGARLLPIYRGRATFGLRLSDQWPVVRRLVCDRGSALWHFFFAPNPRASGVARACAWLRRQHTVQTVCSAPAPTADLRQVLFADRVVVLSIHTERRFLAAGVPAQRLLHIPPCVPAIDVPDERTRRAIRRTHGLPQDTPLLLYPGDLEFGGGAERCLRLLQDQPAGVGAHLLYCCRDKTGAAQARRARLQRQAAELGLRSRVHFAGDTPHIHALLAAADVVLLPSDTLYAKMDLPLVLLEAMALERAVVVLADTPAAELAEGGGACAVSDDRAALAETTAQLLDDGSRRVALGRTGRAQVLSRYSPSVMAAAYESLYDQLLN